MRHTFFIIFVLVSFLFSGSGTNSFRSLSGVEFALASEKDANIFNPWMNTKLPNTRKLSSEGAQMLGSMGGGGQRIESEAGHRKNWKEEIYPVVFGNRNAPNEIIVILDFAIPQSEKDWDAVAQAAGSLSPQDCKIVIFGRNTEHYGTDLTGFAIWLAQERPAQAMPYLSYALKRWNEVKAAQKNTGSVKKFTNEYDATITPQDYPILYSYLMKLNPPVPANSQLAVTKYCYDAGNVNMYQANQICEYFGIKKLPAVIINGQPLEHVTTDAILSKLR